MAKSQTDELHGEHFTQVPTRLLEDLRLSAQAVRVYGAIRSHLRPNGRGMFPGQERLAAMCGCSVPTVQRAVADLVQAGWLKREQKARKNGQLGTNVYTLCAPAITDDARSAITGDARPDITGDGPEVEEVGSRNVLSNESNRAPASAGADALAVEDELEELHDLAAEYEEGIAF